MQKISLPYYLIFLCVQNQFHYFFNSITLVKLLHVSKYKFHPRKWNGKSIYHVEFLKRFERMMPGKDPSTLVHGEYELYMGIKYILERFIYLILI